MTGGDLRAAAQATPGGRPTGAVGNVGRASSAIGNGAAASGTTTVVPERLDVLRNAFDMSFAAPPRVASIQVEDLLAVQMAKTSYAIRVGAITGLYADRVITPLPGPMPELLGVAGFRGSIIPVYDLGALLGHGPSAAPRWLVLDAGTPALALAFDSVDGHLRVPVASITVANADSPDRAPATSSHEVVRTPQGVRPVVGIAAVRAAIEARARQFHDARKR